MYGPKLLPNAPLAHFYVVVCKTCQLTRFFVRQVDMEQLDRPDWVRVEDHPDPLGLNGT